MEASSERPPGYTSHAPEDVILPSVPQHAPDQPLFQADITLPDLKTVLSSEFENRSTTPGSLTSHQLRHGSPTSVRSLPRIDPGYAVTTDVHSRSGDMHMGSPVETGSAMSGDDQTARSTSVSIDDPDVRLAAEALSEIGKPVRSSGSQSMHVSSHASPVAATRASDGRAEPEPLLQLVSEAHPWVAGTIKGSMSAYRTTKYYSPRIVRIGVNILERNIGTPVASAVGSVSAMTGVEAGLRRHLDARRPNDLEQGPADKAAGDVDSPMEIDDSESRFPRPQMNGGLEQLPPYGASRPPSYREEASPAGAARSQDGTHRPPHNRSWSSQIFVTTSGLSVALSTASRSSLRYCIGLLAQQTDYVSDLMRALQLALNNYEETRQHYHQNDPVALEKGLRPATPDRDENARRLAEQIRQHCDNIWQALRYAVNAVSNYAGGALPQNAREFVRAQLMSLPQRWRLVSDDQSAESETSRAAQRMIDFADQGLDMMHQVSDVLSATLRSAEQWLERVGRRDQEDTAMQDAAQWRPSRESLGSEKS